MKTGVYLLLFRQSWRLQAAMLSGMQTKRSSKGKNLVLTQIENPHEY